MKDGCTQKSKLSWSKKMVRKLFSNKCKSEDFDFLPDDAVHRGVSSSRCKVEYRTSFSEREPSTIKKSKTEKFGRKLEEVRRRRMNLDHPRIIDVHNYSIFTATWNVAGKSPPNDLNLDDLLHSAPPADIYVLGFQEIVPLNAGNILGTENNGPAKKWLALIRNTLNNLPGASGASSCYRPSPIPKPIIELNADFERSSRQKSSFFQRRSFQTTKSWRLDSEPSTSTPQLDQRLSVCDRIIFGHRQSDFDPRLGRRPSDYSRASDFSRPSDYSRWGSSDDDNGLGESPSPSTLSFSPISRVLNEDGYRIPGHSRYCLVASKQMVGVFLTIWMRSDLKEHVRNMKISCVGRGLMGYLGNKGSISVSMHLHQTSFCFICSHLTSGQKEGDEVRRNLDVMEILKKTRFPRVDGPIDERSPETILEHDRIIWLGDLNYRIALSYRTAKALVEMQNWRALLGNDQLRIEQKYGRVFVGWKEGRIYFPPTYKYSTNSDQYSGDGLYPKEKRRTPAWCDRILWHGEGLHQLSYVRGESRFSDHRPVCGVFWAEVESEPDRLKKSASFSGSRIAVEELLPYSHAYTELNFF